MVFAEIAFFSVTLSPIELSVLQPGLLLNPIRRHIFGEDSSHQQSHFHIPLSSHFGEKHHDSRTCGNIVNPTMASSSRSFQSQDDDQETHRPYRRAKRSNPCDLCRERKLRCRIHGQPPCQRCREQNRQCTFRDRLRRSRRSHAAGQHSNPINSRTPSQHHGDGLQLTVGANNLGQQPNDPTLNHRPEENRPSQNHVYPTDPGAYSSEAARAGEPSLSPPTTHYTQHFEDVQGYHATFLGSSSEYDPWLLKLSKFDQSGPWILGDIGFRNADGVSPTETIPSHFILKANNSNHSQIWQHDDNRRRLVHQLIPLNVGARLIRLFHKHVFHLLPIVSRTELGLFTLEHLPCENFLASMPVHLLASLYAIALPFRVHDDFLAEHPENWSHATQLWTIAHESINHGLILPKISVVQAALLYLHKRCDDPQAPQFPGRELHWSFLGSIVGLVHNLGLHLDCRHYRISPQEKRLRRRLWWAIYTEDKFQSLLYGRPPYLHQENSDVSELDEMDFLYSGNPPPGEASQIVFQDMARLAQIAEGVQSTLYSPRSNQKLAEDPRLLSVAYEVAIDQLEKWRESVSVPDPFHSERDSASMHEKKYPASIFFAYLTLQVYVWKILIRISIWSLSHPEVNAVHGAMGESGHAPDPATSSQNFHGNFTESSRTYAPGTQVQFDDRALATALSGEYMYRAAQIHFLRLIDFSSHLSFEDLDEFWYSWSATGFSVASSYIITLLVNAPNVGDAMYSRSLFQKWKRSIMSRSHYLHLVSDAMIQVTKFSEAKIPSIFNLPSHVQESLGQELS